MNSDTYILRYTPNGIRIAGPDMDYQMPGYSGDWSQSTTKDTFIQTDINQALIWLEGNAKTSVDEESVEIHLPREVALRVGKCGEYRTYIQGAPDALALITDQWNSHRRLGLAPYLYGLLLRVEGCKYPPLELIQLIRKTASSLRQVCLDFDKEAYALLMEGTKFSEPFTMADEPQVVHANTQ